MRLPLKYRRFFRYSLVGTSTFLFDLILLSLFIDILDMPPTVAAGIAFLMAVSVNYMISSIWIFPGTSRKKSHVFSGFYLIAFSGLLIVSGGMYILTEVAALHFLLARFIIAGVTGLWNYLLNLYQNFKVVGKELNYENV